MIVKKNKFEVLQSIEPVDTDILDQVKGGTGLAMESEGSCCKIQFSCNCKQNAKDSEIKKDLDKSLRVP